jgi:cytochrome P450
MDARTHRPAAARHPRQHERLPGDPAKPHPDPALAPGARLCSNSDVTASETPAGTRDGFSLGDLVGSTDPYALFAAARAAGPVLRSTGSWLVLGHAEATALLRSVLTRSGFIADLYRQVLPPGAARDEMAHRVNFLDPPDHTRVRRVVAKAFTPRRVEALKPYVAALCRELLAPLAGAPRVDLIAAFAHQVPSLVISELLGVPAEDRHRLTVLSDRVSELLGLRATLAGELEAPLAAAESLHAYLRELLERRRRRPADDLLSALLAAEEDGERLTERELLSLAATLYSAGHRTTRDLFANGLSALLPDRALVRSIQTGAIPVAAVIEEFLRFETPTHYVARMLAEPMELGGVEIPAGEPIAVVLAAANRDPAAYAAPDRFDPARWLRAPEPPPPLSFAFGAHFCLGASLARLEADTMLETLLAVLPAIALAGEPLRWRHTGLFRSLEALPVRPGPAASG